MSEINQRMTVLSKSKPVDDKRNEALSRRIDLATAFRIEVGRAYLLWFGYEEAVLYLKNHDICSTMVTRILDLGIHRGSQG